MFLWDNGTGKPREVTTSRLHREENPHPFPIQASRAKPGSRIVASVLRRRRQRPDGHGRIFLQRQYAPTGSERFGGYCMTRSTSWR